MPDAGPPPDVSGAPAGPPPPPSPGAAPPGAAPPGAATAAPSQAPANPSQMLIAQMFQICRRMEMENPQIAAGMRKACEGLQEAQTAMVMNRPQMTPPEQNPPV